MTESLSQFLLNTLKSQYALLDRDANVVKQAIQQIVTRLGGAAPTRAEMDTIFEVSPTLGFTIWQHYGAMRILSQSPAWLEANPDLWREACSGGHLLGFAVTHLSFTRPSHAHLKEGKIYGVAPWSSGFGIFDSYILGCRGSEECNVGGETLLIRMPYPNAEGGKSTRQVTWKPIRLAAMNGTSSVVFQYDGATFEASDVIVRSPSWPPASFFVSQPDNPWIEYVHPELGTVVAILNDLKAELGRYPGVRKDRFLQVVARLEARANEFRGKRDALLTSGSMTSQASDDLQYELCELAREAVRTLSLLCAGSSLGENSVVARRQLELILLDARSSSDYLFNKKLGL